ncbi:hypothetical protein [Actinacidiphila glaucinigra]|uniref:hypothetical protein n=1 Tax=Actinacidiphila glaucinigra TaxID=235986 RepID=UPI0029B5A9E8|nr:hypothetical protein [Streptomyces sp. PA03-3a]
MRTDTLICFGIAASGVSASMMATAPGRAAHLPVDLAGQLDFFADDLRHAGERHALVAGRALRAELTTASRRAAVRRYTDGIHPWGRGFLDSSHESARYAAT